MDKHHTLFLYKYIINILNDYKWLLSWFFSVNSDRPRLIFGLWELMITTTRDRHDSWGWSSKQKMMRVGLPIPFNMFNEFVISRISMHKPYTSIYLIFVCRIISHRTQVDASYVFFRTQVASTKWFLNLH